MNGPLEILELVHDSAVLVLVVRETKFHCFLDQVFVGRIAFDSKPTPQPECPQRELCQLLFRQQRDFHRCVVFRLINLIRPVLGAHGSDQVENFSQHNNHKGLLFPHHAPKVANRFIKRTLSCDVCIRVQDALPERMLVMEGLEQMRKNTYIDVRCVDVVRVWNSWQCIQYYSVIVI